MSAQSSTSAAEQGREANQANRKRPIDEITGGVRQGGQSGVLKTRVIHPSQVPRSEQSRVVPTSTFACTCTHNNAVKHAPVCTPVADFVRRTTGFDPSQLMACRLDKDGSIVIYPDLMPEPYYLRSSVWQITVRSIDTLIQ